MPESAEPQATRRTKEHVHEGSDVRVRRIFIVTLVIAAVVVLVVVIAGIMNNYFGGGRTGEGVSRAVPPQPRLQVKPLTDIAQMRREKNARLGSYGWVDKDKGVVHIPIERAMSLLVQGAVEAKQGSKRRRQQADQPQGKGEP